MSKPHGMTTMTSGSRATNSGHVIHGECLPASPKRLVPPASSTSSGTQFPAAIKGSIHSMQATVGRVRQAAGALGDGGDPLLEVSNQRRPALWHTERLRHVVDVSPDVSQGVRLQRDEVRAGREPGRERALDVLQADGADLTLRLGDDDVWL